MQERYSLFLVSRLPYCGCFVKRFRYDAKAKTIRNAGTQEKTF